MSDNEGMVAAILITLLAVLCTVGVFAVVLVMRRPDEGWRAWFRSAMRAWRSDELSWVDTDDPASEVGGLGALYQLSEPGNAYFLPPEDLEGSRQVATPWTWEEAEPMVGELPGGHEHRVAAQHAAGRPRFRRAAN